ncbi:MAG: conjugal transfer protein TrbE [Pseudomonadota bacterium]
MMRLAEYQKRPTRLADYLPWAALVAPGVVLNKDGSFQRTAAYRGPDLESSTRDELVSLCARVNNVLRRFGSGWALFFEAARHPAPDYPHSAWREPVAWLIDEERRGVFEDADALFESAYYLTFSYLPPADAVHTLEDMLLERAEDGEHPAGADQLAVFLETTDRSLDLLANLLPSARFLDDDETLTYLQSCVSPKPHIVRAPEFPAYLDAVLGGADLVGGLEPILGGSNLRVLSIQGFPNGTEPGLLDELNSLGFSYRWCTRFLPMDKAEAVRTLTRYRRQWFAKRKSVLAVLKEAMTQEGTALVDADADNKAADADDALQALGGDHVAFGFATTSVVACHADAHIADAQLAAIERVINGRGYVTIKESVNAVDAWLGGLPGHAYANVRQPIIHTLNLAHMTPLSAVWAGPQKNAHLDGPPLLYAKTSSHTPFRLVPHQGDVGHTLIVGPTGAGKSVLLSLFALQFRRYANAQTFLFDKGASAKPATLGIGGDYFDLGGTSGLCFQPLAKIDEAATRAWALDWLCGLVRHEGVEATPEVKQALWSALEALASAPLSERTLTGLSALLQSSDVRQALQPFTLDGAHGALLDADDETLETGDWQCFEMEALMHQPALALPVLTYLFHRLEARFDGRPTQLILDEAWVFLDDPVFAGRIREWLKTLRKKNVSVIFATQSLADIATSKIAPAIMESCPSRIFLPNDRALEPQQQEAYARFGLNARQIEIIAQAIPKQDYYFQSRAGNRLFDLSLGPVALAFCGASTKEDLRDIDACLQAAGIENFPEAWLRQRGLDWAADLLANETHGGVLCAAE